MPKSTLNIILIVFLSSVILAGMAGAGPADSDWTHYNFIIPGNAYAGAENYTYNWLARRYDGVIAYGDHPLLGENIFDEIQTWSAPKSFVFGPYHSTQELTFYASGHPEYSYDYRVDNGINQVLTYAEHYMDSVNCDRETLYVHIADAALSITNADGTRANTNIQSEILRKRRFSYQYWNNNSGDTGMYPQGYCWLANGFCDTTLNALAYAYVRYFIQDSAIYGDGHHHYTAFFSDNQYRSGTSPRLPSYYTINSSSGGPTSGMDWLEISDIESNQTALYNYYDNSTLPIDSAVMAALDSACAAHGLQVPRQYVNTDRGNYVAMHNTITLPHTGIEWENCYEYTGMSYYNWIGRDSVAHLARILGQYLNAETRLDNQWDNGSWNTKDRTCLGAFAWYLTLWDTSISMSPVRWTDTTKWSRIFELNIGDPIWDTTAKSNMVGSGSNANIVFRRLYMHDGDSAIALFRTAYGAESRTGNEVAVYLDGQFYHQITLSGSTIDTGAVAVDTAYLNPMEGWIGVALSGNNPAPVIDSIGPDTGTVDVQTTFGLLASDAKGGEFVACGCYAITPSDDSSDIFNSTYVSAHHASPIDTTFTYTPTEAGAYTIGCRVIDDSSAVTSDYIIFNVSAAEPPPEGSSLGGRVRMRK